MAELTSETLQKVYTAPAIGRSDVKDSASHAPVKEFAMSMSPHSSSPRAPRSARTPRASSPARRSSPPAAGREDVAGDDGRLTIVSESGAVIHVSPPDVTRSIRYMLGRMRVGDASALPERFGLVSALSGEGTTFLARSLALTLSNDTGRRVCLVDMNWSSPSTLGDDTDERGGLADVLRGDLVMDDVLVTTGNEGLSILPAGSATPVELPVLAHSPDLEKHLVELGTAFDHLIIDLPAVGSSSEAAVLAENCSAIAVIVNQGVTPDHKVKSALEELAGIPMSGLILNRSATKVPRVIRRLIPGV